MARHPSDPELKAEFSAQIRNVLAKGESISEVAKTLHVSIQTVYNYRRAAVAPSPEVIRRAMEKWNFSLTYRGRVLSLGDFGRRKPTITKRKAEQLELWEAIKKLDSQSVEIEVLDRRFSSVRLGVRIRFNSR